MPVKKPKPLSPLEELLALQIRADKVLEPRREYAFSAARSWRFDFAWPAHMLAVEVEGGIHGNGRHNRADGFEKDAEKYNEATLLGWRLLRFTGGMVKRGEAINMIKRALENVCQ